MNPPATHIPLEMAHVLFLDLVGWSKKDLEEQALVLRQLQTLLRSTAEFRRAEAEASILCLPSGDGMAVVFRADPASPARCAVELARALLAFPNIQIRMGMHTGPV